MNKTVKPLAVTEATFEAEVLNSDIPVIVDIWAEWCGPCRMLTPLLDKFATELDGLVKIVKLNRDENQDLAVGELGAESIPRLLVFQGGSQVAEQIGLPDYDGLKAWFVEQLTKIGLAYEVESPGEEAYAQAVAQAFKTMNDTVNPASQVYSEALKPFMEKIEAYKAELEGEGVEGDELAEKIRARQTELMPEIQPAIDAYQEVAKPAEEQFIRDIEAATAAFVEGTADDEDGDGEPTGDTSARVCQIGDPNCQS